MKWLYKIFKFGLWLFLLAAMAGTIALGGLYLYLEPRLPATESLRDVAFQVPLRVYTRDRKLIAEFGEKRRIPLTYDQVPERMVQAFLAAEDDRFFEHPGVDYQGLLRAAAQLLLTGEKRQGGSTITMQVARNFFLSRKKTYTRKLNEILLALRIEKDLTKQEILELYLNKIYMGHRAYGAGAAAQVYYGKTVDELELPEIAMIAGLPKAPSRYNPITDSKRAVERRDYVLGRMHKLGYIDDEEYRKNILAPVSASLHAARLEADAPYVAEMVRSEMTERYGNNAYTDGYSVVTTIDSRLQAAADAAVRNALQAYDQRHGYRGAEKQFDIGSDADGEILDSLLADHGQVADLPAGLVTKVEEKTVHVYLGQGRHEQVPWIGLEWARPHIDENRRGKSPEKAGDILKTGDLVRLRQEQDKEAKPYWRLAQIPQAVGALVSLDPVDGALLALVGGYDFYSSKFNRVTQAKRQPGSGFKAFIYSAALEAGFTAATLINDAPVVFDDPSLESAWRPENYSGKFFGPTRLRYALTKSRNLVSIRLLRGMGIDHALNHIAKFGFDPEQLPHNLSLALGSGAVTPLQMAAGYAVLANGGYRVEPYFMESIENAENQVLYRANPVRVCPDCPDSGSPATPASTTQELSPAEGQAIEPVRAAPQVISPQNHFLMNSMMRDVITRGTATKARVLGRSDLAGKTGTTNEQRDAWFNGFNSSLVAVAWVGFDSSQPLGRGEVGGKAALPAWIEYMKVALDGVPEQPLKMPADMISIRIDPNTGKRASAGQKDAIFEVFRRDFVPDELVQSSSSNAGRRNTAAGSQSGQEEDLF